MYRADGAKGTQTKQRLFDPASCHIRDESEWSETLGDREKREESIHIFVKRSQSQENRRENNPLLGEHYPNTSIVVFVTLALSLALWTSW